MSRSLCPSYPIARRRRRPALSRTRAFAGACGWTRIAAATPNPTSHLPSRTVPGCCLTAFPLEPSCSFAQALDYASLGVRHILLWIDGGLVQNSQLDRIHVKRMREFVHRRLKRQQAGRFAWRAYILTAQHVERNQHDVALADGAPQ